MSGRDCIRELDALAADLDARDVLVIVDRHVCHDAGLQSALDAMQGRRRVTIAEHDGSEPSLAQATDLAAREAGQVSPIVAVGGGSTIDIAKGGGAGARLGRAAVDALRGGYAAPFEPVSLVAAPETAGTGSEVTGSCVLTDYASGRKVSIRSPKLRRRIALLDPHFLASMPRSVIRSSDVDALTHALEAYHSTGGKALRLVRDHRWCGRAQGRYGYPGTQAPRTRQNIGDGRLPACAACVCTNARWRFAHR